MTTRVLVLSAGNGAASNLIRSLQAGHVDVAGAHWDRFVLKKSPAARNFLVPATDDPAFVPTLHTGSDVGRGTAAGYVNMSSKVPHLGSSSAATFAYGNGDRGRVTADLNFASSGNSDSWWGKSALRLNALWQDGGVQGRDEVEQKSRAVAPSLAPSVSVLRHG